MCFDMYFIFFILFCCVLKISLALNVAVEAKKTFSCHLPSVFSFFINNNSTDRCNSYTEQSGKIILHSMRRVWKVYIENVNTLLFSKSQLYIVSWMLRLMMLYFSVSQCENFSLSYSSVLFWIRCWLIFYFPFRLH
jgi:hypothetical protein